MLGLLRGTPKLRAFHLFVTAVLRYFGIVSGAFTRKVLVQVGEQHFKSKHSISRRRFCGMATIRGGGGLSDVVWTAHFPLLFFFVCFFCLF